jgi:hypothetical protein
MKPVEIEIEGAKSLTFAKDQPEYQPLPCAKLPNGDVAIKWQLDDAERDLIWINGAFYLTIKTFNQPLQPLMPMADQPSVCYDEKKQPFFYSLLEWKREQGIPDVEQLQDSGLPTGYRDAIYNDVHIHFGFLDRLKILFGWKVDVDCKTFTQQRPGNLKNETVVRVYRDRKLPQGWGTVESAAPVEASKNE